MAKKFMLSAGNSTDGQSGFVIHGIPAKTPKAALKWAQERIPESVEETLEAGAVVVFYTNAEKLTVADVSEEED